MRKTLFQALAIAIAIAATPFAKAESFTFDFVSQNGDFVAQGILTANEIGATGAWNITGMTGTFTDTDHGLGIIDQAIHLYPDQGTPTPISTIQGNANGYFTQDGAEGYDNLLYSPGNPYYLDAAGGLVFYTGTLNGSGYEIGIAQGLNDGSPYTGWINITGTQNFVDNGTAGVPLDLNVGVNGSGAIAPVPEPESLLLLGSGLLTLAGRIYWKAKPRAETGSGACSPKS